MSSFEINLTKLEIELANFKTLLTDKRSLGEMKDVAPFIKRNKNFSAFLAGLNNDVGDYTYLKTEFSLHRKYRPDLVVGDIDKGHFCFIEFEDASIDSVFTKAKKSGKSDYAARFGKGFGQLIDWLREIDIHKSNKYVRVFEEEVELISYKVILVIGRTEFLSKIQKERLRWFQDYAVINSQKISILTYDDILEISTQRFESLKALTKTARTVAKKKAAGSNRTKRK